MEQFPAPAAASTAPGVIRTAVPAGVGAMLAWLASLGVEFDPNAETALGFAATAILGGLYYWLVRKAARRWPQLEWLLGLARVPVWREATTRDVMDLDTGETVKAYVITNIPNRRPPQLP